MRRRAIRRGAGLPPHDTELDYWGNDYLLRYGNRFVELSPSFELEPRQMELVGEAFGK